MPGAAGSAAAPHAHAAGHTEAYFGGLDLIRFAAAIMVALFHLTWRSPRIGAAFPAGWVGVEIFFMLSGAVIAQSANGTAPARFLKGRIARLYPAAWICLLLSVIVVAGTDHARRLVVFDPAINPDTIFSSILFVPGSWVNSAYWTLPVELAFYAAMLVLIVRGFARLEAFAVGLVAWSGAYLLCLAAADAGLIERHRLDLGYGLLNMLLLRHGLFFAFGILLWLAHRRRLGRLGRAALLAILPLGGIEIADRAGEIAGLAVARLDPAPLAAAAIGLWLAFAALLAWSMLGRRSLIRGRARGWAHLLGLVTYPLYLLHEAIGGSLSALLQMRGVAPGQATAIGLGASILCALAVVRFGEPPLRRALQRLVEAVTDRLYRDAPARFGWLVRPGEVADG